MNQLKFNRLLSKSDSVFYHLLFISGSTESGMNFVEHKLTLDKWLGSLGLDEYIKTFQTNLFTEMDRVSAIWDDELTSILDIEKIGHRKRILLSLAGRNGMPHRFGKVKASFYFFHLLPRVEATETPFFRLFLILAYQVSRIFYDFVV